MYCTIRGNSEVQTSDEVTGRGTKNLLRMNRRPSIGFTVETKEELDTQM